MNILQKIVSAVVQEDILVECKSLVTCMKASMYKRVIFVLSLSQDSVDQLHSGSLIFRLTLYQSLYTRL